MKDVFFCARNPFLSGTRSRIEGQLRRLVMQEEPAAKRSRGEVAGGASGELLLLAVPRCACVSRSSGGESRGTEVCGMPPLTLATGGAADASLETIAEGMLYSAAETMMLDSMSFVQLGNVLASRYRKHRQGLLKGPHLVPIPSPPAAAALPATVTRAASSAAASAAAIVSSGPRAVAVNLLPPSLVQSTPPPPMPVRRAAPQATATAVCSRCTKSFRARGAEPYCRECQSEAKIVSKMRECFVCTRAC